MVGGTFLEKNCPSSKFESNGHLFVFVNLCENSDISYKCEFEIMTTIVKSDLKFKSDTGQSS